MKDEEILEMSDEKFLRFHKSHKGHQIILVDTKFLCSCNHIFGFFDIISDIPKRLKKLKEKSLLKFLELKEKKLI